MKNLLVVLGLLLLSGSSYSQRFIQLKFQSTRDSINFIPVEGVKVGSMYGYQNKTRLSDENGEYYFFLRDSSELKLTYSFEHPYCTFPNQPLFDFPYELKDETLTFTITGIPIRKNHSHTISIKSSTANKYTKKSTLLLRALPKNTSDSVILLDMDNKYLGSYRKSIFSPIQTLAGISYESVAIGGKMVNINSGDTTVFWFDNRSEIIPEIQFHPIQRAESEFETIAEHYRITKLRQEEIDSLEKQIDHLEDSITEILNPTPSYWGPIGRPHAGIIDGVYIPDTIPHHYPEFPAYLNRDISKIVTSYHPKKAGSIVIEMTIDEFGIPSFIFLSKSDDFEEIQQAIIEYLKRTKTGIYSIAGVNHKWVKTFHIFIQPKWME